MDSRARWRIGTYIVLAGTVLLGVFLVFFAGEGRLLTHKVDWQVVPARAVVPLWIHLKTYSYPGLVVAEGFNLLALVGFGLAWRRRTPRVLLSLYVGTRGAWVVIQTTSLFLLILHGPVLLRKEGLGGTQWHFLWSDLLGPVVWHALTGTPLVVLAIIRLVVALRGARWRLATERSAR